MRNWGEKEDISDAVQKCCCPRSELWLKTCLLNIKVAKKQNVSGILCSIVSIFNYQKNLFCLAVTVMY